MEITDSLPHNHVWVDDIRLRQVELKRQDLGSNSYRLSADFFRSGISLLIKIIHFNGRNYLNFEVKVPRSNSSEILGLLGNLDGDCNIEFFRRGETEHIPYPSGVRPDRYVFEPISNSCK